MRAPRLVTPLLLLGTVALFARLALLGGVALAPGVVVARAVLALAPGSPLALAVAVFAAYFTYAICVIPVLGAYRLLTGARSPLGRFPWYSWQGFQWARYNSLILLVRHTSMGFLRLTPLITLFHRAMGMRVGARVQINTAIVFDSNLIEIGDDTVIGGDVTLIGHTAERGRLVTGRVRIGRRVTVGVRAIVLPGVEIGDDAVIAPNTTLARNTRVGPGEVWAGSPGVRRGTRRTRVLRAAAGDEP